MGRGREYFWGRKVKPFRHPLPLNSDLRPTMEPTYFTRDATRAMVSLSLSLSLSLSFSLYLSLSLSLSLVVRRAISHCTGVFDNKTEIPYQS
jgi:hypothetical protein